MKVLLVDQDAASQCSLKVALANTSFDVIVPSVGQTALDVLLSINEPCIALVDPVTSQGDGLSVCREIRSSASRHSVYLILLTSLNGVEHVVTGLDSGADDYVTKPYDVEELKARVRVGERTLKMQDALIQQAQHDPLTMLPNRFFLADRLANCGKQAREDKNYRYTLLLVDIDRFKVLNDSLGQREADELMRRISQRLVQTVRTRFVGLVGDDRRRYSGASRDMVARLSGDEFVVLLDHSDGLDEGTRVADRIHKAFQTAFHIGGQEFFVTVSIGISTSNEAANDSSEILRGADNAMNKAKLLGRARSEVHAPTANTAALNRLKLENDLRRALENDEFEVHYQPIVDLSGQRIISFEALMRWRHPQLGLVPPISFIPLAEEIGLILPMGSALLRSACKQIQSWNAEYGGDTPATVCVNVSPRQFVEGNFVSQVKEALAETGLQPKFLELEVTENLTMSDANLAGKVLQELSEAGVAVSLDDFGTGYSSLSYLLRLPIGTLKIDRSFVAGIEQSSESLSVVQTIIALGHNLGMKVIAEGIETTAQLELLMNLKCDFGQGYLFSPALEPSKATEIFAKDRYERPFRRQVTSLEIPGTLAGTWVA